MRRKIYTERILIAFAFALMLHFILIQLMVESIRKGLSFQEPVIEVEYLKPIVSNEFEQDDNHIEKVKKEKKEEKVVERDELEKREKEEIKKENGQIVYIGETESNKAPEKYRFLAEHNSVVEKETRSKYADNNYLNPAPGPQIGENIDKTNNQKEGQKKRPAPDIVIKGKNNENGEDKENIDTGKLALKIPKILKSESMRIQESETGITQNSEKSEELNGKDKEFQFGTSIERGEELHKKRLARLFPEDIFSGKYSGGPFNDWLNDIEESDSTFLNAKEYKYATFFNRIKKSVSQYWNPSNVILKYDPYGNIYGNKDRLTIVKVKIDSTGNLKDLDVSQSSGVDFLDRVAMDAFRSAQPFPNPPRGLMDENGDISFNFGFYVEFSKSSLRLFKYE